MKTLHLIQKPQLRGAEMFTAQLASHINDTGNESVIVYLFNGTAKLPFTGKMIALNGSPQNRLWDVAAWRRLAGIINEEKPDIVQANAGDTMKYAALSKLLFKWKQPIFFRNASTISLYIKTAVARKWNSFLFRYANKIISVSKTSAADFSGLFPEHQHKVTTIPIGIETNDEASDLAGISESVEGPLLIHVGGFTFEKNHRALISIFGRVLQKIPNAKLLLLGDGPLRKDIEGLVSEMQLNASVSFAGFRHNATDHIRRADMLVLPSIIEGLPGVILEAFYTKTPVVAYDTGGIGEVVIDKQTGRLIPQGQEQRFADAVIEGLTNKENNRPMIEAAYRLVTNNYTNKKIAQDFLQAYQQPVPVLHIIKSLGRGGAEMLLPETLGKHDRTRFEFHYIYFLPWKDQMVTAIEGEGGKVTCMSASNNIRILTKVPEIAKYVKTHRIRLIHCHMPWAGVVGRIVGKIKNVPVVYTEHNLWERYHKLTYALNKFSFPYQKKVIAVSDDVLRSIGQHYSGKLPEVKVVLNGVNTDKFSALLPQQRNIRQELKIGRTAVVIGICCVFRAQKRLTLWLEIARRIHELHPDTVFLVVGDGVLRKEIFAKAREFNMDGYLRLAGLQPETRPYLLAMDIFMMSSEFEGLPIALLEAMSMGCMPACTDAGGIPELVVDNKNGILVPVNDAMMLVQRVSACLDNPAAIKYFGNAARDTVLSDFSMQKMVGKLEGIYEEMLIPND